jgi:murein DD-endopeptidase MepM/ murein hydrolase activator NlpD
MSDPNQGPTEPGILERLGFAAAPIVQQPVTQQPVAQQPVPQQPAAPAAQASSGTRREARELERRPAAGSASRRIRQVQKGYGKPPKGPRGRPVQAAPAPRALTGSTPKPRSRARKVGSRLLSLGAMIFAGALAIGMSVPANAFGTGSDADMITQSSVQADKGQAQTVEVDSTLTAVGAARDTYTITSWADMLRLKYGTRDFAYSIGNPNGPIRWPFPYPVPISSGFGERAAPCRACSSIHMGLDFTPGEGAPIYAAAAGTIVEHKDESGGFGNHVIIDHGDLLGDGTDIQTLYGHMQHGSVAWNVGDTIKVGDFIGTVGQTGVATGPHLHFEVHVNGTPVDPFAWLKLHTA